MKEKLKSRKLWAAIVGVVIGLATAFGLNESEWTQVAGVVTSLVSVISYIFAESSVDKAGVIKTTITTTKHEDNRL